MIRVAVVAVMMTWLALSVGKLTAQDLRIDPTIGKPTPQDLRIDSNDPAAVRTTVEMLARNLGQFAGMRVRIIDAEVEKIVSPRAFILTGQRQVVGLGGRDRVGVIVVNGTASVIKDQPIVVTGAAGTFLAAQVSGVLTRIDALTGDERSALRKHPLIAALAVDTPANVSLLRGEPTPAVRAEPAAQPAPAVQPAPPAR